jgi:glycosyltransferase involved in cell wall biosynthesis
MSSKVLSVVIPTYNMEKYLRECLDSFVVPSVLEDIEILVVNDGSSDGSQNIAMEYCQKYPDTFFLYNKENAGHGSGINYGLKYAAGRYFKVVDADDWVASEELAEFVARLKSIDTDIVATDYLCIDDATKRIIEKKWCTADITQYGNTYSISKGEVLQVIKLHSLTIKTDILRDNNIKIDEHSFYVDAEYISYPIPYADSVYFYKGVLYMYRLGRNGQSMNIRGMQQRRGQHMNVLNHMLEYYDKAVFPSDNSKHYMELCIAQMVENQFQIYISLGLKKGIFSELKSWDKELKKNYPAIYNAADRKSITMLRKTGYLLLPAGALVYRVVKRDRY